MKDGLLGDTIRRARMDNKMTQEQLAEAINISPTHMKHIESEHRKPSVEVLFLLADVLNFSMDAMLMETQSTEHAKRVNEMNLMMNKCTDEELDVFLAALRELMKHCTFVFSFTFPLVFCLSAAFPAAVFSLRLSH